MDWLSNFFIPLIKAIFIFGISGYIVFIVIKAFRNAWRKSWKYSWKYSIKKRKYPEHVVLWCYQCIEKGIGYYDAKKLLMVKMCPDWQINETLWIFDRVIDQLNKENKEKGGLNGRRIKRCNSPVEGIEGTATELPTV